MNTTNPCPIPWACDNHDHAKILQAIIISRSVSYKPTWYVRKGVRGLSIGFINLYSSRLELSVITV